MTAEPDEAVKTLPVDAPLVEGSLWRAIWIMSWPLMITTVSSSIVGMVDVQVSGYISSAAQAAVGLAEHVIFLFMVFLMSISVGTTAIVSRAFGAADEREACHATAQSLSLALIVGVVTATLALATGRFVVPLVTQELAVIEQARLYLDVFGFFLLPFSVVCTANAAFRGIGDAKMPLYVILVETVINIFGDYLTVVYQWPVPGLGVRGIAYSALTSAVVGAAVAVVGLNRSYLKASLRMLWPLVRETIDRITRIGVPSAFQRLGWAASVFVLFAILARLDNPTAALASWTIGIRVEGILFMPLMAFSLAVGSIVGQNLGAGKPERAFRAGWQVTGIGVALMVILSAFVYIYAKELAQLISHDAQTVAYTVSYLQINSLAEPFLAVNMILSGALQGAGDTRVPMWISLFSNWMVRLPTAWYLALASHNGPPGAWWSMFISILISAILIGVRYQSGAWLKSKV